MSVNLSNRPLNSMKDPEANPTAMDQESKCKGLYQFYWALRARNLPKLELNGLPCDKMIIKIEEWLNSTDFSNLTSLCLANQGLTFIPPQIARFKKLTWLDLGGNQLENLPDSMSELTQLKHLDIAQNRFSQRPQVLDRLVSLKHLFGK